MDIFLFPAPRTFQMEDVLNDFSSKKWIKVDSEFSSILKEHVKTFISNMGHLFLRTPQIVAKDSNINLDTFLNIKYSVELPIQGYSIKCTNRCIEMLAGDEAGAFYGLQTLTQILHQSGAKVPEFQISDNPDFKQRGMMLDISRCKVPTMESLKKYIDCLASLKLNQLQLYTEHTFAFSRHETVYYDSSPMTSEEIIEIDAYCSKKYIELVPNFNSFGHFERWLKHPEYRHLAESPDGFEFPWGGRAESGGVLYPDDKSLTLIDSLYDELLPNFSSKFFNIGCDETWELGQGKSKEKTDKEGTEKVYFDFLLKLADLVKKHKRKMMFWGDIILKQPELINELPKDVIALNWGYEADHPYNEECAKFANAGVPFYVCPGTSSWNSIIGVWEKARKNLLNAAENGLKFGAEGYLITDWGDGGHHQYLPISYPGILAGACFSWCFETNKDINISKGLDLLIFKDRKEVLGQLLLDISQVQNCIPVVQENCSAFGKMLFFTNKEIKDTYGDVSKKKFDEAIASLDNYREQIKNAQANDSDSSLVEEEINAGVEMAKFAAIRARAVIWPDNVDKIDLKHRLEHIIRVHENLWLRRNRHGGLRESSDRLRSIFEQIND